jgi:GT2 family glycosyltransferase
VVVTHNGRAWLKECLVALNAQRYAALDVLVVDDASGDFRDRPHLKRVVKRHLRSRRWAFLRTPRPLGFGGAANWALARVRTDADLLLFVHDDAALDDGALGAMVARISGDDSTAIVGPKVVSWADPLYLEEVGMAVDRFGYPYKGLDAGEIDIGQHDVASEVFFVTSTCLLVRHEVFGRLGGWDAAMRAFSEDMDLCWRARLAGYAVRVEPLARVRHAVALATGLRESPFGARRYFSRRNRLRALVKNASAPRLVGLVPQFVLVTLAEMLGFIVLRQPREIVSLARALGWNLWRLPDTVLARFRAQGARTIPDRSLRRLTVRESTRVRAYVGHQAGRLEVAWGHRAELVAAPTARARAATMRLGPLGVALAGAALVVLGLGLRHYLWGPPASVGELVPYPASATAMWRALVSPWRATGLGAPGPVSPAFAWLGVVPLLALGAAGAAQKLLVFALAAAAFIGAYRLLLEVVDRPARWATAAAYTLGGVGYSGLREGALGALVFGAAAPFALHSLVRLTGWARPPGWRAAPEVAKLAIAAAISASLVPGSLALYGVAAAVLAGARWVVSGGASAGGGLVGSLGALVVAWLLLLPWSATWLRSGGVVRVLVDDPTMRTYAAGFRGHGMASVLLGRTPGEPLLVGIAFLILGGIAVVAGEGQRRRMAIAFWVVVVAGGWFVAAVSTGVLRPIVTSPTEAGVLPALGFAALAGLATGAARLDLARRRLGLRHAVVLAGVACAAALVAGGIAPAVWSGAWDPGRGTATAPADELERVRLVLGAQRVAGDRFRVLWVGRQWSSAALGGVPGGAVVTGPEGRVLTDLLAPASGPGIPQLDEVVRSITGGATDAGGQLLSAFAIRYVVVGRPAPALGWLAQRDLAVIRSEPSYWLLENKVVMPHAAVLSGLPPVVRALAAGDPTLASGPPPTARAVILQGTPSRYSARAASGPGVVFLGETRNRRWRASLGGRRLERADGGWGNAWTVPSTARGTLNLSFPQPASHHLWLAASVVGWLIILGAARPRRPAGSGGAPRRRAKT